jgi:DsbC/DsbD-like thiol-disulfide interchange protein
VNGKIIGYKHRVVFTSDVLAINEDQPINLDVTAQLGICREICIPVKVELALNNINQTSKAEAHQEALNIFNESHKKLPKEANEQLRITQITTIADKAGYLKITAKIPENA